MRKQGFDLAGEDKDVAVMIIIERLLAHAVARQKQTFLSLVPQRDGDHPAQMLPTVIPVCFV